jgi:hypothetical protein
MIVRQNTLTNVLTHFRTAADALCEVAQEPADGLKIHQAATIFQATEASLKRIGKTIEWLDAMRLHNGVVIDR